MNVKSRTVQFKLLGAALAAITGLSTSVSIASNYPERAIRIVVPYNAGGGTDILARAVANAASEALKQPVVVENRPGASGMTGSEYVARAPADGYTLLMTAADTHSVNPHVYPNIRYDAQKDFQPVSQVGILPYALVVSPKLKVNSLKDFIELAKKQPGKLTYSSWGVGSTSQVAMEMFNGKTGIKLLHVPFTGAAPAMTAVVAGQTDAMFVPLSLAIPNAQGGKVKILGLGAPNRFAGAKDIPTLAEQGVDLNTAPWIGILAPSKVSPDVLKVFHSAVAKAGQQAKVRDTLTTAGLEIEVLNPQQFGEVLKKEYDRWGATVKQSGIKAE